MTCSWLLDVVYWFVLLFFESFVVVVVAMLVYRREVKYMFPVRPRVTPREPALKKEDRGLRGWFLFCLACISISNKGCV